MRRYAALLLLTAAMAGAQTVPQPVLLHDCQGTKAWTNVSLVTPGKVGRQAIQYRVPDQGGPSGTVLQLGAQPGLRFEPGWEIAFWYRFTGRGASSLFLKLVDAEFSGGYQAVWPIAGHQTADGIWRRAVVDLGSEWLKWGDRPTPNARYLNWRTEAAAGSAVALEIDQVMLVPHLFEARVTSARLVDQALRIGLRLTSQAKQPLPLLLRTNAGTTRMMVPAGGQSLTEVAARPDPEWLRATDPLTRAMVSVQVLIEGQEPTMRDLTATVTKPMALPPHPRLLIARDELPALKDRAARLPWAKSYFEGERKRADEALTRPVQLPDRGGQWWHWYACKQDGARLKTVSPTQHECPVCKTVYTGWPYDDVVLDRIHGGYSVTLRGLALVYQMTGEPKYAAKAKEILLAYAERYLKYPLHDINGKERVGGGRVGPQTLDESTWLIGMAQGADMIWDTLSDAERQQAEHGLFRPAAEVIRKHQMGIHNIQCWKNSAVGLVGLLLNDADLVADAVSSPHGFQRQMAEGVSDNGQWWEGAWGYHFYTMMAVWPLAEAGQRCGLGLYAYESQGRSFRRLFDAPLDLSMPDLRLPAFNDSGTVGVRGNSMYELALARYRDPRYAIVLEGSKRQSLEAFCGGVDALPEAPAAARGSRNFPAVGYAVLEHGRGPDATWLCLKYGPHGGGHGHPDKLNAVLYRRGTIIGVDPGTAAYGVPIQREWFRTTLAHNTLTVDEANQREATGQCLAFATQGALSAALAEAGPVYPGVTYRRAVALCGEDLVLVLDLVNAVAEHTFDLVWHNAGQWATAPTGEAVTVPSKAGYQHLAGVVRAAGALPLVKASDRVSVGLAVGSGTGETWAGTGVGANTADRVPFVLRRARGKMAVVGWALHLDGQVPQVTVTGDVSKAVLEATIGGRTARLTVTPDAAGARAVVEDGRMRLEAPGAKD